MSDTIENVLILQGGGSLGAFGCGVLKALASSDIKMDVIAGTSIGGLNASVIAGSKEKDHPERDLEQFWLELAEGSSSGNPDFNFFPFMKPLSSARVQPMSTDDTSSSSYSALTHI